MTLFANLKKFGHVLEKVGSPLALFFSKGQKKKECQQKKDTGCGTYTLLLTSNSHLIPWLAAAGLYSRR